MSTRIKVCGNQYVSVGDHVRVIRRPAEGPPVGAVLPILCIQYGLVRVPWASSSAGYGKMPESLERAYDADYEMDEGL